MWVCDQVEAMTPNHGWLIGGVFCYNMTASLIFWVYYFESTMLQHFFPNFDTTNYYI